jgi:hypothetical protein
MARDGSLCKTSTGKSFQVIQGAVACRAKSLMMSYVDHTLVCFVCLPIGMHSMSSKFAEYHHCDNLFVGSSGGSGSGSSSGGSSSSIYGFYNSLSSKARILIVIGHFGMLVSGRLG